MIYRSLEEAVAAYIKLILSFIAVLALCFILQLSTAYFQGTGIAQFLRIYKNSFLFYLFQFVVLFFPFLILSYPFALNTSIRQKGRFFKSVFAVHFIMALFFIILNIFAVISLHTKTAVEVDRFMQGYISYQEKKLPRIGIKMKPELQKENLAAGDKVLPSDNLQTYDILYSMFFRFYNTYYSSALLQKYFFKTVIPLFLVFFWAVLFFKNKYINKNKIFLKTLNFTLIFILNFLFYSTAYFLL
ncbi:MAG TPA: hypothetical protein VKS21_13970 [Spirochaetota bacterium]|nr:hypothetical protein [Spirochaetota bacterium]